MSLKGFDLLYSIAWASVAFVDKLQGIQFLVYPIFEKRHHISKHFITIDVRVVGLQSLFSAGQGFLETGVKSIFFRRAGTV